MFLLFFLFFSSLLFSQPAVLDLARAADEESFIRNMEICLKAKENSSLNLDMTLRESLHQVFLKIGLEEQIALFQKLQDRIPQPDRRSLSEELLPLVLQRGWERFGKGTLPEPWCKIQKELEDWAIGKVRSFSGENRNHDGFQQSFLVLKGMPYFAVGHHPAVLALVQKEVTEHLRTEKDSPESPYQQYVLWLSDQAGKGIWQAHAIIPFLVSLAQTLDVPVRGSGNSFRQAYYEKILNPAIQKAVYCFDPESISLSFEEFSKWFLSDVRWKTSWQGKDCSYLLWQKGCEVWENAWKEYQSSSLFREKFFHPNFVRLLQEGNVEAQEYKDWQRAIAQAKFQVITFQFLVRNPWTNPWIIQTPSASTWETSLMLSWCYSQLHPVGLYQLLEQFWPKLLSQPACTTDNERWLSLDLWNYYEPLRGRWHEISVDWSLRESPSSWQQIGSEEMVIRLHWHRLKEWIANSHRAPTQKEGISLAVFCWLGLPQGCESLPKAIGECFTHASLQPGEKAWLRSCQLHLGVTSLAAGNSIEKAFAGELLLSTSKLDEIPQFIEELYKDGRPFAVRSAAETCWILGRLAQAIDPWGYILKAAQQSLQRLSPLLRIAQAQWEKKESKLSLALLELQWEVEGLARQKGLDSSPLLGQRPTDWLNALNQDSISLTALGHGYWGLLFWLNLWQAEAREVAQSKMLALEKPSKEFHLPIWNGFLRPYWGILCAMLCGGEESSTSLQQKPGAVYQLTFWNLSAHQKKQQSSEKMPLCYMPWANRARIPIAMLQPLLEQATTLEDATPNPMLSGRYNSVDFDGLTENHLPNTTWAGSKEALENKIREIESLEERINEKISHAALCQVIESLKPLISAPIVLNMSAFREELNAAVAQVRQAEAHLRVSKAYSLAAEMELMAKNLLLQVTQLEEKRAALLLQIHDNQIHSQELEIKIRQKQTAIHEIYGRLNENDLALARLHLQEKELQQQQASLDCKIALITTQIAELHKDIQKGKISQEEARIKMAELDQQKLALEQNRIEVQGKIQTQEIHIRQNETHISELGKQYLEKQIEKQNLEIKKWEIEIATASHSVASVRNYIDLIEYTILGQRNPENPAQIVQPAQLKVLAQAVHEQVKKQREEIRQQRSALQKNLDELREEDDDWFGGICSFLGCVVGNVLGGPAGAALGNAIGGAAGEIISGIVHRKPLGKIFLGLLDNGQKILNAGGFHLEGKLNALGGKLSQCLGRNIVDIEKMFAPALKNCPAILSHPALEKVLDDTRLSKPLKQLMNTSLGILKDAEGTTQNFQHLGSVFTASIKAVALSGKPEDMRSEIERRLLQDLPHKLQMRWDDLKQSAQELGMTIDNLRAMDHKELAKRISFKLLEYAIPEMQKQRDLILKQAFLWLPRLQETLRKGEFSDMEAAIVKVAKELGQDTKLCRYKDSAQSFLLTLLKNIPIQKGQEIDWAMLCSPLRSLLKESFPNEPEQIEMMIGQLQLQLDSVGAKAQIQQLLQPWHESLQKRLNQVQETLSRPTSGDQESQLVQQIQNCEEAERILEKDVLEWLQNENSDEVYQLRLKLGEKKEDLQKAESELEKARLNLSQGSLGLEQAKIQLEQSLILLDNAYLRSQIGQMQKEAIQLVRQQTGISQEQAQEEIGRLRLDLKNSKTAYQISEFENQIARLLTEKTGHALKKNQLEVQKASWNIRNTELDREVAQLQYKMATLSSDQAALALENLKSEKQRAIWEQEKKELETQITRLQRESFQEHCKARRAEVEASAARLDMAIAQYKAAQQRANTFGRIEIWYYHNLYESPANPALSDIASLQREHSSQVKKACFLVREMLRILRILGKKYDGFSLPEVHQAWGKRLKKISLELTDRYLSGGIGLVLKERHIELGIDEIAALFPTTNPSELNKMPGLTLEFVPTLEPKKEAVYLPSLKTIRFERAIYRHPRVFLMFIMAQETDGTISNYGRWKVAPVIHDEICPGWKNGKLENFVCAPSYSDQSYILYPWEDRLSEQEIEESMIDKKILAFFGVQEISQLVSKQEFQRRSPGMSLYGKATFRIAGKKPQKVRLMLVYTCYP